LRGHAGPVRVCELPRTADDRGARYGVSPAERLQFLADSVRRAAALLQFSRRQRPIWRRKCTRRRLVGILAAALKGVLAGSQRRLLDYLPASFRIWQHWYGHQYHRHRFMHAMPGNAVGPHAPAGLAQSGDVRDGPDCGDAAIRGAVDAARRSLSRRPLLRYTSRRLRYTLD